MTGVWDRLHWLFDTDDGSLPEVLLTNLSVEGVAAIYAFLRSRGDKASSFAFWHRSLDREEQIDAWPNAALLVATGQAEAFHFMATGLAFDNVVIPDLGVFVFPEEIALDYRMGRDWDERRVLALFELLRQFVGLDPNARVKLNTGYLPSVEATFVTDWMSYCREKADR
jgi:hypothetical protein